MPTSHKGCSWKRLGQGYQHSKSLHGLFSQIPGIKIIMPTTPNDAKGMIKNAIKSDSPVISFEHRWLYWQEEELIKDHKDINYDIPSKFNSGKEVTIISTSWMNVEASMASKILKKNHDISLDLFDLRSSECLNNLSIVIESVKKTGRCIIADNDWLTSGLSGEIAFRIQENCITSLKSPIKRVGFKNMPCPTARNLENHFYPNAFDIVRMVEKMLGLDSSPLNDFDLYSHERKFKGPF